MSVSGDFQIRTQQGIPIHETGTEVQQEKKTCKLYSNEATYGAIRKEHVLESRHVSRETLTISVT